MSLRGSMEAAQAENEVEWDEEEDCRLVSICCNISANALCAIMGLPYCPRNCNLRVQEKVVEDAVVADQDHRNLGNCQTNTAEEMLVGGVIKDGDCSTVFTSSVKTCLQWHRCYIRYTVPV